MAMRRAIAEVPQGTYRRAFDTDGILGHKVHIEMAMTFDGRDCLIDFEGSSPQINGAALNCAYTYTYAYTSYGVKLALLPGVRNNEGVWRPIKIKAPLGSVLNHTFPTSGASRSMLGQYLPAAALQCLAQAVPGKVMGSPGSPVWSLYRADLRYGYAGDGAQIAQRPGDAAGDVRGGRALDGMAHHAVLDNDGIRVGPADVDADAHHRPASANTERKSRS